MSYRLCAPGKSLFLHLRWACAHIWDSGCTPAWLGIRGARQCAAYNSGRALRGSLPVSRK
ncbi:hypothetical protein HYPSUDRAFT_36286, partial [Hypholoma sublateritium FD-334 SS-4]